MDRKRSIFGLPATRQLHLIKWTQNAKHVLEGETTKKIPLLPLTPAQSPFRATSLLACGYYVLPCINKVFIIIIFFIIIIMGRHLAGRKRVSEN